MKRWTGMLGVLLMTLLCTHALAVGGNNAVYQIIRHTETGEAVLGTAVAITDNCLITADTAICAAAEMRLVGEHEELTVDTVTVDRQDTGLAVITVTECITDILQLSVNPAQTGITIQTDGSEVKFTADAITRMQINQTYDGVALSVPENALPGTVLLSEDGQLAGICVAFVGEGINRAAALTGKGIYALLVSGNGMNDADQQERVQCFVGNGLLNIDFSRMKETGVAYTIVVADRGNISVLAYEADEFTQMVQFVATPGRSLTILVWKTGEENDLQRLQGYAEYTVPAAEPFTMYGYHDAALYVTMAGAADEFGDTDVIPQSEITADMLTSESYALYLMADSVYEVETKAQSVLTCMLVTPDDRCYAMAGGFVFDQAYMPHDTWHWDLTGLFGSYLNDCGGKIAAGTYTVTYYLDGAEAGTASFTVDAVDTVQ